MSERPHDCVASTNALLADRNTRLAKAISFGASSGRELIQLATVKVEAKKRGREAALFASFCPFCGRELSGVTR